MRRYVKGTFIYWAERVGEMTEIRESPRLFVRTISKYIQTERRSVDQVVNEVRIDVVEMKNCTTCQVCRAGYEESRM